MCSNYIMGKLLTLYLRIFCEIHNGWNLKSKFKVPSLWSKFYSLRKSLNKIFRKRLYIETRQSIFCWHIQQLIRFFWILLNKCWYITPRIARWFSLPLNFCLWICSTIPRKKDWSSAFVMWATIIRWFIIVYQSPTLRRMLVFLSLT